MDGDCPSALLLEGSRASSTFVLSSMIVVRLRAASCVREVSLEILCFIVRRSPLPFPVIISSQMLQHGRMVLWTWFSQMRLSRNAKSVQRFYFPKCGCWGETSGLTVFPGAFLSAAVMEDSLESWIFCSMLFLFPNLLSLSCPIIVWNSASQKLFLLFKVVVTLIKCNTFSCYH